MNININKEEPFKNLEKLLKQSKKIKSNYSHTDLIKEDNEKYYFITFLNYFCINWQINIEKRIDTFLEFFELVNWNKKDKLTFFYIHFQYYLHYFSLAWNDEVSKKYTIQEFFLKNIYLDLENKDLDNIYITSNKDIDLKDFLENFYKWYITDIFESVYYTYYNNDLIDCKYKYDKKVIINTLSYLYNVLWDEFEVKEEMFQKKWKINYSEFLISYYYVWFINVIWINYNKWDISLKIKILPELKIILDDIEEKRELIMDKVFDEKYKEIKLKKKNWIPYLLESNIDILWNDSKFVELKNKYPFSEIKVDVHNKKINKYQIKEKIKLKKDDK